MTTEEALSAAKELGYPVLMRPSYVLGGQNMIIAHSDKDIVEYMAIITSHMIENPVLIDKYMMGTEVEVDAICDGTDFLIPGIMEHVERAGVHSGDSISIPNCSSTSTTNWNVSNESIPKDSNVLSKVISSLSIDKFSSIIPCNFSNIILGIP